MKNCFLFLIILFSYFLISCGKNNHQESSTSKSSYWENKAWDYLDDDADGITNGDEIKSGSHPELITAPHMKNFTLTNVYFFLKEAGVKLNAKPLRFEVQHSDANYFLYSILAPMSKLGSLPTESYDFKREHYSIITEKKFRQPHIHIMKPKIESSYLSLLQNYFYNREIESAQFKKSQSLNASFTLNFSTDLNTGTWSKISGELIWGSTKIPWQWTKGSTSQLNWQIEVPNDDWINIMKRKQDVELHILNWEIETPVGKKHFTQDYLKTLTPFYVITDGGIESGWHNSRYPLPAENIIQRQKNPTSASPWYFFKVENPQKTISSLWLKELTDDELELVTNLQPLHSKLIRSSEDLRFISLPPFKSVNALTIKLNSAKFIYPKYVFHVITPQNVSTTGSCISHYPEFNPKNPHETITSIDLNRILNSFIINSMPLKELIKTQIYLSFEYNNNNISAVTLHWRPDFIWNDFSILGLKNETFYIEFDPVRGPICPTVIDSPHRHWPKYKSEEIFLEWKF